MSRDYDLSTQVAAFLLRSKLVFEVYSCRSSLYHCLHQFERVERASESCFCVSYYRREPVDFPLAVHELYLVCSLEGLIDPLYQMRDAVGRVQALVWVSLA